MTHCSESNQEATMPTNLQNTKSASILGTWNVRTMYQSGKASQIAKEMHKYKIEVMGLSETRWISTGKTILATGEVVFYSGNQEEDSPHTEGVAFMMTKEASKALISWEPISSRIITASFQAKQSRIKSSLTQCYAPTNDAKEREKENFSNTFNAILNQQRRKILQYSWEISMPK